ncbi:MULTISPECIES: tetratricopeptide repeat protein [Glaesserella]|uniref:Sel1 repeat family protein n=1 Tax=Glaesserella australis TaxID=2094024 RepID=A0A328BWK7_9PAST|nr:MULTISPECIES: tetratricopeptide repeat protein [Glaesserella]AUI65281.1 hypothetical protein CJD39_01235 [Glaesserella sp. 15-184]RAL18553.1 hypothetical protein C5N92_07525 [Glaesserella australis]
MKVTTEEKNGDNVEKTSSNAKYFEAIQKYSNEHYISLSDLAKKIYLAYIAEEESYTEDEEKSHIKNFASNLKKSMQRKEQGEITIHKDLSVDKKKISVRKICEILNLDIQKEITYIGNIAEYNIENYRKFNKDAIANSSEKLWNWFEEKALKEVEYYAERNKKEAITTLAHYYYYFGKNSIRNVKTALKLYEQAASEGDEIALYQLGIIYEYETGEIPCDENKSFKYYQKSADLDFDLALNKLAYCYYEGKGVPKNLDKFFEYTEKSSKLGNLEGKLNLAFAYANGIGVNKNVKEAINIYDKIIVDEPINEYTAFIYMTLSYLYRTEISVQDIEKSKIYLIKYFKMLIELIEKTDDNNLNILTPIYQMMNLTPEKLMSIERNSHYDRINNPVKPTVLNALIS